MTLWVERTTWEESGEAKYLYVGGIPVFGTSLIIMSWSSATLLRLVHAILKGECRRAISVDDDWKF